MIHWQIFLPETGQFLAFCAISTNDFGALSHGKPLGFCAKVQRTESI